MAAPRPRPRPATSRVAPPRPSGVRAVPPSAAIALYARALLDLDAALERLLRRAIREELPQLLEEPREDADGPLTGPAGGIAVPESDLERLLRRLSNLEGGLSLLRRRAEEVLERVFSLTSLHSETEWGRALRALGINLDDVQGPNVTFIRQLWRRRNLDLIKRLCERRIERVETVLLRHRGARVQTLARRIQEATGTGPAHARLLARDQTLKLYGQVTQARHQSAGVTEYIWRASRDERVRQRHRDLDGTRHKYSDPPVVDAKRGRRAHPGDDFQCRCTADPILPGLENA